MVSTETNYRGAAANVVETRITQLIEDRALREKMGQQGREFAEDFDVNAIAKKLAKSHKGPAHRARVNFELCFPDKTFEEREALIEKTLYTAALFFFRFSLLTLRISSKAICKSWVRSFTLCSSSCCDLYNCSKRLMFSRAWAI